MKIKNLMAGLGLSIALATSAQAASLVAGWDFSQYVAENTLSIDNATFTTTLGANYSALDASFGAGPDSAPYGTMYIDGQFGSTNITPDGSGNEPFVPIAGSLATNLTAPQLGGGASPFDSLSVLLSQGQQSAELFRMQAISGVSVAFQADPGTQQGSDWVLTFAAQTFGGAATVNIAYSTDGTTFVSAGSRALSAIDTAFSVALGAPGVLSNRMIVQLSFSGNASLDNVALSANLVPEPATASLLAAGLLGLVRFGRRRSA